MALLVQKKGPGHQPEVDDHELHIKPVLSLELENIDVHEGIGQPLYEIGDGDDHQQDEVPRKLADGGGRSIEAGEACQNA
jgi:hypothetical protein